MSKITLDDVIQPMTLESIHGENVSVPHPHRLTHIQFRRFAGCPMCNLHIQSFIQRFDEIDKSGIEEVAVFHSSQAAMKKHHANAPFALIGDPTKSLYRSFGVESSLGALMHPRAWLAALRGVLRGKVGLPAMGETPFGLPADFLIDCEGRVLALKYGKHAYDQWEVDDLLAMAKSFAVPQE